MTLKTIRAGLFLLVLLPIVLALIHSQIGVGQSCTNEGTTAGSESCDAATNFSLTLQDVVAVDLTGSVTNETVARSELGARFLPLTSSINVSIHAVTDYSVSALIGITNGTSSGTFNGDALLEVDISSLTGDEGDGDDPSDSTTGGCDITSTTATGCDDVTSGGTTLWTGGNSVGGTNPNHTADVDFRIDLDALGDASTDTAGSANQFTITITFRVTEN